MKNHQLIKSIAIKLDIIIIDPTANPNIKLPSCAKTEDLPLL